MKRTCCKSLVSAALSKAAAILKEGRLWRPRPAGQAGAKGVPLAACTVRFMAVAAAALSFAQLLCSGRIYQQGDYAYELQMLPLTQPSPNCRILFNYN